MAKKKRRRRRSYSKPGRRRKDNRLPLLPMLGLGATLSTLNRNDALGSIMAGDFQTGINSLAREAIVGASGYDIETKQFNFHRLFEFYVPLVAGVVGSKVATKFGANRYLKKVPIVGKWIKL